VQVLPRRWPDVLLLVSAVAVIALVLAAILLLQDLTAADTVVPSTASDVVSVTGPPVVGSPVR
jgi:hypothetical protein